jgi:transposase
MKAPLVVRPLTDADHDILTAGRRSADAFPRRRCQILLARARGERPRQIATALGCSDQTVRDAISAFTARGTAALIRQSSRPATSRPAFAAFAAEQLRELRPRAVGDDPSSWTLALVAEVSVAEGLTTERVSGETVRATLTRLGVRWQRAKRWIASPDPADARTQASATA